MGIFTVTFKENVHDLYHLQINLVIFKVVCKLALMYSVLMLAVVWILNGGSVITRNPDDSISGVKTR